MLVPALGLHLAMPRPAPAQEVSDPAAPAQVVPETITNASCEIIGEVYDALTLEPVAGAFVEARGTGRSAETDAQGRFTLAGLPAGALTVEATKLGYSFESAQITTAEGKPAAVRIGLRAKPADDGMQETLLEEETVVGEYQEESQGDFNIDLAINTSSVTSGISKEEFTKTGVSDAAGAVGKVAGANIVGGKFAVVRGLADRYVTTLFNGAAISSADPSRKAVQLDIFPTTAIQGIDIHKTYTPDLPGDFGGGTIRIQSLNLPDERIAEFKYKVSWNSKFGDRMLIHPDRGLGFLGDVDQAIPDGLMWNLDPNGQPLSFNAGGNRVVPGNTANAAQRQTQIKVGAAEQAQADDAVVRQRALHASQSMMPRVVRPEEGHSSSLVYGDRIEWENGNRLGWIAALQRSTQDDVNSFAPENRLTSPARSWTEESYTREVDASAYLGLGFKAGEEHEFNATYFRKHIASDEITHGTGFQIEGDERFGALAKNDPVMARYGASAVYNKEFWSIAPVLRDTELRQIGGTHQNQSGTKLAWLMSLSSARESRPHTSTLQHGQLDFADPAVAAQAALDPSYVYNPTLGQVPTLEYQTFVNDGIGTLDSSRETQLIEENARELTATLTQDIHFTEDTENGPRLELSGGAGRITKDREQKGRVYLMRSASWERWVARNPPAWWTSSGAAVPFSPGSPLASTTLKDGSPLPAGFKSLGEYLAANPDRIAEYFNGYGDERTGTVPGTGGSAAARANYVMPDAPYYLNGSGLEVRNVDSELSLASVHASSTLHAGRWKLGGGARWEEEQKSYEVAADPLTRLLADDPSRFGGLTTNAFIPALYGGFDIVPEESWVNVAWSRTVARPTFHEFLPIESISQDTGILRRGNPALGETEIENFDISLDWNITETLQTRCSLFHKQLADPIVVVQRVDLGENSNTYVNGDSGEISGIELEGRWKPAAIPFSLTGNCTVIDSTLNYEVNQGLTVTPLETRFPFQPSMIVNLTLGWEPESLPWSVFLTANQIDEYPTILRSEPSGYDVWIEPQLTLDLLVARKWELEACDATLTFGIRNLLSASRRQEYRGGSPSGDNGPLSGLTYSEEDPGMTYSMELKAAF